MSGSRKIAGFENEAGKMFIELVPQTGAVFRGVIIDLRTKINNGDLTGVYNKGIQYGGIYENPRWMKIRYQMNCSSRYIEGHSRQEYPRPDGSMRAMNSVETLTWDADHKHGS